MKRRDWLPYLITLSLVLLLVLSDQVWAKPIAQRLTSMTTGDSTRTINYQGYLTDADGSPVDDTLAMVFRLYNMQAGGAALWSETQATVPVNDGLFSVLLGSMEPLPQTLFLANDDLWLGITIGGSEEIVPREKLASVPYALASEMPLGVVAMWSGTPDTIPPGWALCDGSNGTPDLRDEFIVGAGRSYTLGEMGGVISSTLTLDELATHSHPATAGNAGSHTHTYQRYHGTGGNERGGGGSTVDQYPVSTSASGDHTHAITVSSVGGGQPHENLPPYYSLAFICRQ